MREQKVELSKRLMKNKDYTVRVIAINMYKDPTDTIPDEVIQAGLKDRSMHVNAATISACMKHNIAISPTIIYKFMTRNKTILNSAMHIWEYHSEALETILKSKLTHEEIPLEIIKNGITSNDMSTSLAAMKVCAGRDDVPLEWIERGLKNNWWDIREAAMNVCAGRDDVPLEWIEEKLQDEKDPGLRATAIKIYASRVNVPFEWIEENLKYPNGNVRMAAASLCAGRDDIPLEWIEDGLNNSKSTVIRFAAINACIGRDDIPLEWIKERLFNNDFLHIQLAAVQCFKTKNLPIPLKRTFEPPDVVYKKCINGVIVCAEIPADAQVRGVEGCKCRADKAKIIDIIGGTYGEKVGISTFDNSTLYFVGDEVNIEDFNYSNEECSTGFHFFCTEKEAKKY